MFVTAEKRGGRIQYTPQYRYFEEAVKWLAVIEYPEQTDEILQEAFRQANAGTPGPVYIEIPMNTMQAELDLPPPPLPQPPRYPIPTGNSHIGVEPGKAAQA